MSGWPDFTREPASLIQSGAAVVHGFEPVLSDAETDEVDAFAAEWERFPSLTDRDLRTIGDELFDLWEERWKGPQVRVLDVGCGNGRWSRYLSPMVGWIDAVDPGDAVRHGATVNAALPNVRWSKARAEELPFPDGAFEVVLCVGVLHHLRDPVRALRELRRVLKPGGWLYFYIYYALEQRGRAYKALYRASDMLRRIVHHFPRPLTNVLCDVIAATVYMGFATLARGLRAAGWRHWNRMPLAYYHTKGFRVMRNDALDRFGTGFERRYDQEAIASLLAASGFGPPRFSGQAPFWHGCTQRS